MLELINSNFYFLFTISSLIMGAFLIKYKPNYFWRYFDFLGISSGLICLFGRVEILNDNIFKLTFLFLLGIFAFIYHKYIFSIKKSNKTN